MTRKTLKGLMEVGVALATAVILVRTVAQLRSDPSKEEEEEKKEEAIKPPSRLSIQNGQAVITLDAETQSRGAIATAPLKPITALGQVTAPAVVLSAQELVSLRNSYVAALARMEKARVNTDVAQQQHDRLKALYQDNQNASQKDLQAAQGTLRSNQADLQTAQQDLALQAAAARQGWGDVVAKWIVDDPPPLDRVLDQQDFLVQVTLPRDQPCVAPQTISLEIPGSHRAQATLVSPFPRIDSRIQGLSFLYITPNHFTLAPGLNLVARLPVGAPARGVLVPRSAVVWWQGNAWVYQRIAPGRFVRRPVPTETPIENGVFIPNGFAAGNQIVIRGAQTLLSEEFRSQLQAEESAVCSMLRAVVRFSLRFRGIIVALACALLGYGIYSLTLVRYAVFPEFAPPQVVIQTEAPGLASEQVEVLVTQPIENAINGVPGIDSLRSGSIQGLSVITAVFDPATDVYRDRQVVGERLSVLAGQLPSGVEPPRMTPLTSATGTVLAVGLTSEKQPLMALRTIADWTVRPRLLAVRGVALVSVFGGEVRQIQVQFNPQQLIQYDLALREVIAATRQATGIRGAGFIETPNQRVVLQTEGQSVTAEQLAQTVLVHRNGANVTLGDVARVVDAAEPRISAASVMGQPAVILMVDSQLGANALEVTRALDQALAGLRPLLTGQGVVIHTDIFRPANFIESALRNVRTSLFIGAALIVVVLFLFLFNLRTAAISCAAIPLSLLAAIIMIEKLGFTINTMTLGGLAIAIGEVVDDAVIDVENIYRRLRQNRASEAPRPAFQVVFDASLEVRSAVVYATFAVILVFFPVLTLSGLAGRIFAPLGMAYVWAILASLVVALTVTPALCLLLLGERDLPPEESSLVRWAKAGYRTTLLGLEGVPRTVMISVVIIIALGVAVLPRLRGSFLPELREGHFIVHAWSAPGTALEESVRVGRRITQALLEIPYVRAVAQRVGRAEAYEDTYGPHYSEIEVDLKSLNGEEAEQAERQIRNALVKFPGVNSAMETFLTERIEETISGYTAAIAVNLFGSDLDLLDEKAGEVARMLGKVPGARDVELRSAPGLPQVVVRLRKEGLARWGFDPIGVLDVARTAYGGEGVAQVYRGNTVVEVSVILAPDERQSVEQIAALPLRGPDGNYVPLRELADIYETSGRYMILHEGARRVQTVTCNVEGRDLTSFVDEAQTRISRLAFAPGTYVQFAGTAMAQAQSRRDLLVHSLLAGLGIVLLLSVVMGNYRNLLLVLANFPFALVGGLWAAWATGGNLSLGSLVGFVTLFGITLRNSIMMISHYEHLVGVECAAWGLDTALRGASERLAPILMTALVTGLGLLPLAIGSGDPGREVEGPMAIVILGGLFTSTALNLLVLPTLALRYGKFEQTDASSK